jgi:hypothetical protein
LSWNTPKRTGDGNNSQLPESGGQPNLKQRAAILVGNFHGEIATPLPFRSFEADWVRVRKQALQTRNEGGENACQRITKYDNSGQRMEVTRSFDQNARHSGPVTSVPKH